MLPPIRPQNPFADTVPPDVPLEAELHDGDTVRVGATGFRVAVKAAPTERDEPELPVALAEWVPSEDVSSGPALVGA